MMSFVAEMSAYTLNTGVRHGRADQMDRNR
jgi:hypothetical protein